MSSHMRLTSGRELEKMIRVNMIFRENNENSEFQIKMVVKDDDARQTSNSNFNFNLLI